MYMTQKKNVYVDWMDNEKDKKQKINIERSNTAMTLRKLFDFRNIFVLIPSNFTNCTLRTIQCQSLSGISFVDFLIYSVNFLDISIASKPTQTHFHLDNYYNSVWYRRMV